MVTFEILSFVMENCANSRKYGTFKFEFYDSLCKELCAWRVGIDLYHIVKVYAIRTGTPFFLFIIFSFFSFFW